MPWYVCILIGFIFIGVGIFGWMDSHIREKTITTIEYRVVDQEGHLISTNFPYQIFENYRLVKKEEGND